jgi:hypothetical protein
MNASLKDIWLWIVSLDFPSMSLIWHWLITAPWWLALITLLGFWWMGKTTLALCWNIYRWYQHHLPGFRFRFKRMGGMLGNWGRILRGKRRRPPPARPLAKKVTPTANNKFPDVLILGSGRVKPVTFWARKWLWANTNNNCPSFDEMPEIIDVAGDVEDLLAEMSGTGFVVKDLRKPRQASSGH